MKILFITAEGFDTPNPNNPMTETMLGDFLDNGYKVHLIQSRRKCINPDIPASLLNRKGFSADTIQRKTVDKTNLIKRYLNDMVYAFRSMKYWRKVTDADVVFLQSNPTVFYPVILLKLFCHKPILYNIYDVFPGHAYDIGVIKSRFLYRCLQLVQKPAYKIPAVITVLSSDMKRKVIEQGAKSEKVRIVPPWYDVKQIREIEPEHNQFLEKYAAAPDQFIVQFAGTVGYVLNYHTILRLAQRLKSEKQIVIQVIGDGNVKEKFMREAEALSLDNIVFHPLQPPEILSDVYSACNLCIIPLLKGVIGNGVPSKAPILMACRRVIVNSVELDSDYARMFRENDMGISVGIDDIDGLASAVLTLFHQPDTVNRMADNAKTYAQKNYSSTIGTKKFMDIFDELGSKG